MKRSHESITNRRVHTTQRPTLVTRKGIGMSREHQLTHQLTCRIPRTPSHCRTGSVADVAATGFPVTSTISAFFCVCTWFIVNLLLPLERNEALPSCLPASSRTCQVSLFLLHAITASGWHSPTSSRMQRVLASLDVFLHGHVLSQHTQRFFRPAGREGERRAIR